MDYLQISELYHHGILGQKWGIRRYQNDDGTLTPAGRRREAKQKYKSEIKSINESRTLTKQGKENATKALKIAGGIAIGSAAAYGTYKVGKFALEQAALAIYFAPLRNL